MKPTLPFPSPSHMTSHHLRVRRGQSFSWNFSQFSKIYQKQTLLRAHNFSAHFFRSLACWFGKSQRGVIQFLVSYILKTIFEFINYKSQYVSQHTIISTVVQLRNQACFKSKFYFVQQIMGDDLKQNHRLLLYVRPSVTESAEGVKMSTLPVKQRS